MDFTTFIKDVQNRTQLDRQQAVNAVQATLATLAERITREEANDLAAQLPADLSGWLREQGVQQRYDINQFLSRIAEREGCDETEARQHAQAVFQTLCEAVTHGEMKDVMSQLPKEYQELFACKIKTLH